MNTIDLQGRVAVVTGGAAGIGLAVAHRLAASGARVALWDLDRAAAESGARSLPASAGAAIGVGLDVSDEKAVEDAASRTVDAFGSLDVMVCSAGITGPNRTVADYGLGDWKKVFDVNVHGLFLCNRAAVRRMAKRNYGRIVNVASIAGKEGNPNASAYSASKAAVIGLTKSLGKETAKSGIRVNCVTPAAVKTAIFDQMTQQHIDFMLSKIPMGRFGLVEEMAALIAWLASEECSFSTGAVFDLSGGRAVY
jgi:NAD(P)-dependent dehydrogenase (short-subunit alcohol dehydrogenase family)